MNPRALFTVIGLPFLSIMFFQNCTQSNFQGIDEIQKLNTMDQHSGLGNDSLDDRSGGNQQFDDGVDGNGSNNQNDGGVAGNDGNNQTDGGTGGGMLGPGGMIVYPGVNNTDGGAGSGGTIDGGISRDPSSNQSDGGTGGPMNFDNGDDGITDSENGRFQVVRWCRKNNNGDTMKEAKEVSIVVKDKSTGRVICDVKNSTMLNQMLTNNFVDIPGCNFSAVRNCDMQVEVKDENGNMLSHGTYDGGDAGKGSDNAYHDERVEDEESDVKFDAVALHLLLDKDFDDYGDMPDECDAHQGSPLVVDMRNDRELAKIFKLSSPYSGIDFNILGQNSYPSVHTPKKISWMKDPRIMPIVLPWNGDVPGVDQMFGDNTLGPDNEFSDNGFEALAKYDGYNFDEGRQVAPDGVINKGDAVYKWLRLWHDRDLDGEVDRGELLSLANMGIEIIDLRFDPNYYSRDGYGNEIKYKSVVKLKNDTYKPVFDIWFIINQDAQR